MMAVTLDTGGAMEPASTSDTITRSAYMPYGAVRGDDNLDIDHGWLNQVSDGTAADGGTGLVYLNARYYDPVLSRFVSPDPLMKPSDPKTLDPYRYADNNPISFTDASGLCSDGISGWAYWLYSGGVSCDGSRWQYTDVSDDLADAALAGAEGLADWTRGAADAGIGLVNLAQEFSPGNQVMRVFGINSPDIPYFGPSGELDSNASYNIGLFDGPIILIGGGSGQAVRPGMTTARVAIEEGTATTVTTGTRRVAQVTLNREAGIAAENTVSKQIGVPRNVGSGMESIPGTGPGGVRYLDFPPTQTIPRFNAIVEVKNVLKLSATPQIRNYITWLEQHPGVALRIFTNAPAPVRGAIAKAMVANLIKLFPIK